LTRRLTCVSQCRFIVRLRGLAAGTVLVLLAGLTGSAPALDRGGVSVCFGVVTEVAKPAIAVAPRDADVRRLRHHATAVRGADAAPRRGRRSYESQVGPAEMFILDDRFTRYVLDAILANAITRS
jgi:hypothetical protein